MAFMTFMTFHFSTCISLSRLLAYLLVSISDLNSSTLQFKSLPNCCTILHTFPYCLCSPTILTLCFISDNYRSGRVHKPLPKVIPQAIVANPAPPIPSSHLAGCEETLAVVVKLSKCKIYAKTSKDCHRSQCMERSATDDSLRSRGPALKTPDPFELTVK